MRTHSNMNQRFSEVLSEFGLKVSDYDQSVFYQIQPFVVVLVYVDDWLIVAENVAEIDKILNQIKSKFKIRELDVTSPLGLRVNGTFFYGLGGLHH